MAFSRTRLAAAACAVGLVALAAPAAHADIVYDNLASVTAGSDPLFDNGPQAQSFNSGNGGILGSVTLLLTSSTTENPAGLLQVSLVANSSNAPGASIVSLGTLVNGAVPTSGSAAFSFSAVTPTVLAGNTEYWIEISEASATGIEWDYSTDLTPVGVANQSSDDRSFGVTPASEYGAYQMAVGVPEPMSVTFFASGLLALAGLVRRRKS